MLNKLLMIIMFFLYISSGHDCLAEFPLVTDIQVAQSLSESTGQPLVLIFGAKSCMFCESLKKDISDGYFLMQLDGTIVCYVDVARRQDLIDKYKIKSLPDTRYIVNGDQRAYMVGYDRKKYEKWLSNVSVK